MLRSKWPRITLSTTVGTFRLWRNWKKEWKKCYCVKILVQCNDLNPGDLNYSGATTKSSKAHTVKKIQSLYGGIAPNSKETMLFSKNTARTFVIIRKCSPFKFYARCTRNNTVVAVFCTNQTEFRIFVVWTCVFSCEESYARCLNERLYSQSFTNNISLTMPTIRIMERPTMCECYNVLPKVTIRIVFLI